MEGGDNRLDLRGRCRGTVSKSLDGAQFKRLGAERSRKSYSYGEIWVKEMNESKPSFEAPLPVSEIKTKACWPPWDKAHRLPDYWVGGLRRKDGMTFIRAAVNNSGNHRVGCQPKGTRCRSPRLTVGMPANGAEQLVVALKASNSAGAKGLRRHRQFVVNSKGEELRI